MKRVIAFFLLFIFPKLGNVVSGQEALKALTLLKTDSVLPGPSLRFNLSLASGVFEFEFKTFVETALVLYQDDEGKSDHIQITFQQGRLWFLFYLNKNNNPGIERLFTSKKMYNDFEWHSIRIERNTSVTKFLVDNGKEIKTIQTYGYQSLFTSNLLIGGFDVDQYTNDLSNPGAFFVYVGFPTYEKKGFFNACVRNIRYGKTASTMTDITNAYIRKNRVSEGCQLNYCHKPVPICKNNGVCLPLKNKEVKCNCLWTGYTGSTCTEPALELTLDGTYMVKHHFINISPYEETYSFRIKTFQQDAVLFYARGLPNLADFTLIEIKSSKLHMLINFGSTQTWDSPETNISVKSPVKISDGRWHVVHYKKAEKEFTLTVDEMSQKVRINTWFKKMDYDDFSCLGEVAKMPYENEIKIQDFIWGTLGGDGVNFVTGLFSTYENINAGFSVVPSNYSPRFNRELPSLTPKPMPVTPERFTYRSTKEPNRVTDTPNSEKAARSNQNDEEDDEGSSVVWIVVVTVVLALLLFAAIAFFVYKWNQRYSGDFQVNRKPIGPAGTVVHYQDAAHKEKQRQMRL